MIDLHKVLEPDLFLRIVTDANLESRANVASVGENIFSGLFLIPREPMVSMVVDDFVLRTFPDITIFEVQFLWGENNILELRLRGFDVFVKCQNKSEGNTTATLCDSLLVRRVMVSSTFCRFALLDAANSLAAPPFDPCAWQVSCKELERIMNSVQMTETMI